jgi:hypothetical protein
MKMARRLSLAAVALAAGAPPDMARAQRTPAALVEEIRGEVEFRTSAEAPSIRLHPGVDAWRRLNVGEQVRPRPGGLLRVWVDGKSQLITDSTWYIIPSSLAETRELLAQYARVGGRARGGDAPVLSPSDQGVVVPERFVVRWDRRRPTQPVAFIIREVGGSEVWRNDAVDTIRSALVSREARQALASYRDERGQGPLLLQVVDSDSNVSEVIFALMSEAGERSLKQELARWAAEPVRLVSHLGRAAAFARVRMHPEAAAEYEAALTIAPRSRDLLLAAIAAQNRASNPDRAAELTGRLPPGSSVP